jgi:general secretion pathway protein G
LLEILIVIVVLGILAAVVIFSLGGITGQTVIASCEADGATVASAIAAFNASNPTATPTPALLIGSTDGGPYIQSWPSNLPHHAFEITSGTLQVSVAPPGAVTGTYINYNNSASCTAVA